MTNDKLCERLMDWVFYNIIPWLLMFMLAVLVCMFFVIVICVIKLMLL